MQHLDQWSVGNTLAVHISLRNRSVTETADSTPTYRVYKGDSSTVVTNGTVSAVVDSQTGHHLLSFALSSGTFSTGVYTVRVSYAVSAAARVIDYVFRID